MTDTLKTLKHKRGQLKASVTRFVTFIKSVTPETSIFQIKGRQENIKSLLSEFDNIQSEIEILEELEADNQEREEFENNFFNALDLAEQLFADRNPHSSFSKGNCNHDRFKNIDQQLNTQIRLPKIDLPVFYGSYEDWYPFHDTFDSLIHSNANLSNIQKFHYLKSSVKGEAAACLQSLEITADNYNDAWHILKERYDNKRLIVQKHIKVILELPAAHKEGYKELRQILDGVLRHMRALKSLKRPTEHWDDLIVFIITSKIDSLSGKEWESTLSTNEMPTFKQMSEFLGKKCQTLEALIKRPKTEATQKFGPTEKPSSRFKTVTHVAINKTKCPICEEEHPIYQCKMLANMSVDRRWKEVKAKRLCINCLKANHLVAQCTSGSCKTCHKKHNTFLHRSSEGSLPSLKSEQDPQSSVTITNHSAALQSSTQVLLSTAVVDILDVNGGVQSCRALLDSGSQSNIISKNLARRLGLPQRKTHVTVSGISQRNTVVTHSVEVRMQSRHSKYQASLNCLILERISGQIPPIRASRSNIQIPVNVYLADPDFDQPEEVDLLIGAELFFQLLCVGQINLGKGQPCLQKTVLGWIISGKLTTNQEPRRAICNIAANVSFDNIFTKFWDLEDCAQQSKLTLDERYCEEHFVENVRRNTDGRLVVSLPFKENSSKLGQSREQALKRFYSLEKKFDKDSKLKNEYTSFMHEYLSLGHMKEISQPNDNIPHFYLPHHAVIKEKSITTKLRVVFDGSAKTSTGVSLNNVLLTGTKLQEDLFDIIARFRTWKHVMTADIAKMYRQVTMDAECTPFQRILWRDTKQEAIKTFQLTTVTYGTASASFLAIRALQQLAKEEEINFPIGSKIIMRDFYVGDLTGVNTVTEATRIRDEVITVLAKGCFELRKWNSNTKQLLADITNSSNDNAVLDIDKEKEVNTLGLQWNSNTDFLQYSVQLPKHVNRITKRHILSAVATVFDPLGLLGPLIITAKILIQNLWELKLDWDEYIPMNLQCMWLEYSQRMQLIDKIKIPRNIIQVNDPIHFELHGFCDASEKAYGACIYLKATNKNGETSSNILCSK